MNKRIPAYLATLIAHFEYKYKGPYGKNDEAYIYLPVCTIHEKITHSSPK